MNKVVLRKKENQLPHISELSPGAVFQYPSGDEFYMKCDMNKHQLVNPTAVNKCYCVLLKNGFIYSLSANKEVRPVSPNSVITIETQER